jgi:hypothetical protein
MEIAVVGWSWSWQGTVSAGNWNTVHRVWGKFTAEPRSIDRAPGAFTPLQNEKFLAEGKKCINSRLLGWHGTAPYGNWHPGGRGSFFLWTRPCRPWATVSAQNFMLKKGRRLKEG